MRPIICLPVCACLLLFSCNKLNDLRDRSKFLLKDYINGPVDYRFYYDAWLFLDSVVETGPDLAVTFRVRHHAATIDSILTISNGLVTESLTNIRYDDSGRLTQYFVYSRINALKPPDVYTYTWQNNNLLLSFVPASLFQGRTDNIHFDSAHNATGWQVSQRGGPSPDLRSYTYDNGLNPLFFIKDVQIILGHSNYEFIFSRNNSATKTYYQYNNYHVTYHNVYDRYQRLVKKVFTDVDPSGMDSLQYVYYDR